MYIIIIDSFFTDVSADTEIFKVKKSSHSKRIAKQLKKEREKDEKPSSSADKVNQKKTDSDEEREREKELKVRNNILA